ncbi:hypothetical protein BDR26DRAFT_858733 [Obelidium mucronatum]|nr:hypothetical protein BDR26DRAFT_858733 [Obelidium mucronatum]
MSKDRLRLQSIEAEIEYWRAQRIICGEAPVTSSMGRHKSTSDISSLILLYDTVSRQTKERSASPPPPPPPNSPPPPPPPTLPHQTRERFLESPSFDSNPFYTLNTLSLDRDAKAGYLSTRQTTTENQQNRDFDADRAEETLNRQKPLPPKPACNSRRPQLYSPQFINEYSGLTTSSWEIENDIHEFGNLDTMKNYDYTQQDCFKADNEGSHSSSSNSGQLNIATNQSSAYGSTSSSVMRKGSCMELRNLYRQHASGEEVDAAQMTTLTQPVPKIVASPGVPRQQAIFQSRAKSLRRSISQGFLQATGYGSDNTTYLEMREKQTVGGATKTSINDFGDTKKLGFVGWIKGVFKKKDAGGVVEDTSTVNMKSPTRSARPLGGVVSSIGMPLMLTLRRARSPPSSVYNSMLINPVPEGVVESDMVRTSEIESILDNGEEGQDAVSERHEAIIFSFEE